jgi:hypothetical protein
MAWRIEQAKTDRSSCRECGQRIAKGEHRFGNDDLNAYWYHLGCAEAGKPRAFKPFAAKAATLLAKAPNKPVAKPHTPQGRDADLEARLIASPDDETIAVFADALQREGDPWGELIALELAGKEKEAKKLLKATIGTLAGGFAPRMFEWRRGFIDLIRLESRSRSKQREMLDKALDLRTAVLVRALALPLKLDDDFVAFLNTRVPRTVTTLFTWLVDPVGKLALPNLERLDLYGLGDERPDAAALAPLFGSGRLPKVKRLSICNRPLPVPVLAALLDSPLVKQLEWLELYQNALDDDGVSFVRQHQQKLAHIRI